MLLSNQQHQHCYTKETQAMDILPSLPAALQLPFESQQATCWLLLHMLELVGEGVGVVVTVLVTVFAGLVGLGCLPLGSGFGAAMTNRAKPRVVAMASFMLDCWSMGTEEFV